MKNNFLVLWFFVISVLTSCSSHTNLNPSVRKVASKNFDCYFSEVIDGQETMFTFTPDELQLSISNSKNGTETIFLEEDNFILGGVTYVLEKSSKNGLWPLKKIEFISFTNEPQVTISFSRTPTSKTEKTISRFCE